MDVRLILSSAALTVDVDAPMNIYYFVLQNRNSPSSLNASDLNQLFYYSGGVTQFLSGSGYANTHNINNDWFRVIKTNYPNKPMKLGWAQYTTTAPGIWSNNDFKTEFHFKLDLTKHVNKVLHFNNTGATATNHNWYLCFYVQKYNLNTATTNWDPPQVFATQVIRFEDA